MGSGLSDHAVDDEGEVTQLPSSDKYYDKMRRHGIPVVEWPTESYRSDKISRFELSSCFRHFFRGKSHCSSPVVI